MIKEEHFQRKMLLFFSAQKMQIMPNPVDFAMIM